MKVSICIPTYNRSKSLSNCLNSIVLNNNLAEVDFEVCISDNFSSDDTENVVRIAQNKLPIVYSRCNKNVGRVKNYLNVVNIASGDFIWLLGDDDLLLPSALNTLSSLINKHSEVDFFYINSFCLDQAYISSFPRPFDTLNLPNKMKLFSKFTKDGEMDFFDLIDPKISFDFLGGMFLSVFKRKNWIEKVNVLDSKAIIDSRTFSHFDNTFPHLKIFSSAFSNSKAYFHSSPLSVNLSGEREWSNLSPLVNSVRLVEALNEYRSKGLSLKKYLICKNFALRQFFPDLFKMTFYRGNTGIEFISPVKLMLSNFFFPNMYLSIIFFFVRKILNKIS